MNVKRLLVLTTVVALVALMIPLNAQEEVPAKRFSASVGMGLFHSSDADARNLHGANILVPVLRVSATIWGPVHAWASAWFSSSTDGLPEFPEVEATGKQRSIALGLGYHTNLMPKLTIKGQLGVAMLNMKEETMGLSDSSSKTALALGLEANYALTRCLYVGLAIQGNTKANFVPELMQDVKRSMGGITSSLHLGIVF